MNLTRSDQIGLCMFYLEDVIDTVRLRRAVSEALSAPETAVRLVEQDRWRDGWAFTGGIEVRYQHVGRGFHTYCELECELEEPHPFSFVTDLVSRLGCRALYEAADDVPAYFHLLAPDGPLSIVSLPSIPIYEDDGAACLVRQRSVFNPARYLDEVDVHASVRPDLDDLRRELVPWLATGWQRVRLELTYADGDDEQGWMCRFFQDVVDAEGTRRCFETRNPSQLIYRLEIIRHKVFNGDPKGRNFLVSVFPDRDEWFVETYPDDTNAPSTDAFVPLLIRE